MPFLGVLLKKMMPESCRIVQILDKKGRSRRYIQYGTKKDKWKVIESFLRSPLLKEYYLEKIWKRQVQTEEPRIEIAIDEMLEEYI